MKTHFIKVEADYSEILNKSINLIIFYDCSDTLEKRRFLFQIKHIKDMKFYAFEKMRRFHTMVRDADQYNDTLWRTISYQDAANYTVCGSCGERLIDVEKFKILDSWWLLAGDVGAITYLKLLGFSEIK